MTDDGAAEQREIIDVGTFYQLLTAQLESAYGRRHPRWIRGEIAKVYEKTHLYVDLVDAGSSSDTKRPVLNAHCWASQWNVIKRRLGDEGVTLKAGAVVNLFGYVDLYAPSGRIGFTVTEVDVAGLLGDVARRRLELIARLRDEGLLQANRSRPVSPVPLRVGLVASPQTEGFSDFTGQLLRSRYGFTITLVTTLVQGEAAPAQIASGIERLDTEDLDVICIVRGGGSRGDLACFDDERVARAIAAARTPVFTGIGHTGDEAVADLVAHTSAITPTKLGEDLVSIVDEWHRRNVSEPARAVAEATQSIIDEATEFLGERRRTMIFAVRDRLRAEQRHLAATRERVNIAVRHTLDGAERWLETVHRLLVAYDPQRRLVQGWSIVSKPDGSLVRSVGDVSAGERVVIRVADGRLAASISAREERDE